MPCLVEVLELTRKLVVLIPRREASMRQDRASQRWRSEGPYEAILRDPELRANAEARNVPIWLF